MIHQIRKFKHNESSKRTLDWNSNFADLNLVLGVNHLSQDATGFIKLNHPESIKFYRSVLLQILLCVICY